MRSLVCVFFVLLVCKPAVAADPGYPQSIPLLECINLGLKRNYDVRIEQLNAVIARFNLTGANGAYEPVFRFQAGEQLLTVPGGIDPKKSGLDSPYELTTDSVGMGITGVLPSGLSYGIDATSSRLHELTDFSTVPGALFFYPPNGIRSTNQFTSAAAITLQQPLLRDFWIDRYRQSILVNQRNLRISEMGLRWRMMNLVHLIQQSYYELAFLQQKVRVDSDAANLVAQLLDGTRRQVGVGKLPSIEVQQVEAQVETAKAVLVSSQQLLSRQRNTLRNLISSDYRIQTGDHLEAADPDMPIPAAGDRRESWRAALEKRPDLNEMRLELEKQGIVVRFQFNQVFPSLNLVGGFGLQSQESSSEASLADIRDQTKPQYGFGVVLSIPLGGNQAARNRYRASKAEKEQMALQLKKLEQTVLMQVEDDLNQVQSVYQRSEATRRSRRYAEVALKGEQQKLADGLSTVFFVLQAQQKVSEARNAESRVLVDYWEAVAQLELHEGRTLEKHGLRVVLQ